MYFLHIFNFDFLKNPGRDAGAGLPPIPVLLLKRTANN
jgi:hypothetical protein